jgi:NitT/TauT family transport system substrate-binding protein
MEVIMKKSLFKISSLLLSVLLLTTILYGCKNDSKGDIVKVRLNEVVRSVFYAPMYVAINEGLFEEEGIEIDLTTGQGADGTLTNTQVGGWLQYHLSSK